MLQHIFLASAFALSLLAVAAVHAVGARVGLGSPE